MENWDKTADIIQKCKFRAREINFIAIASVGICIRICRSLKECEEKLWDFLKEFL